MPFVSPLAWRCRCSGRGAITWSIARSNGRLAGSDRSIGQGGMFGSHHFPGKTTPGVSRTQDSGHLLWSLWSLRGGLRVFRWHPPASSYFSKKQGCSNTPDACVITASTLGAAVLNSNYHLGWSWFFSFYHWRSLGVGCLQRNLTRCDPLYWCIHVMQ